MHPVDNSECNCYFYSPTNLNPNALKNFANKNKETTAELLIGFFKYYAWEFDYRHNIISIKNGSDKITKISKSEIDGWSQHDRLSIADPFETWYDIAHVIKATQMQYIRKEFLRAYTLISRTCSSSSILDGLPSSVSSHALIGKLFERADPPPPFSAIAKETRSRANTMVSEGDADGN